jgi:hypothetical protein
MVSDIENKLLQFTGDHHHVATEGIHQFASCVRLNLHRILRGGIGHPTYRFAFLYTRKLYDLATLPKSLSNALVAVFVLHFHFAHIGGDTDVIGDEDDQRIRVRVLEILFDGRELSVMLAASIKRFDTSDKEHLEGRHEGRRPSPIQNVGNLHLVEIELVETELPHSLRNQVAQYRVAALPAEKRFVSEEDIPGRELALFYSVHEPHGWRECLQDQSLSINLVHLENVGNQCASKIL